MAYKSLKTLYNRQTTSQNTNEVVNSILLTIPLWLVNCIFVISVSDVVYKRISFSGHESWPRVYELTQE